jgi:hypothetical protein
MCHSCLVGLLVALAIANMVWEGRHSYRRHWYLGRQVRPCLKVVTQCCHADVLVSAGSCRKYHLVHALQFESANIKQERIAICHSC